jgi:hypothetical protein
MTKINIDNEAYNQGWLLGSAMFIDAINKAFLGNIPDFVMEIIGGEKEVKEVTKEMAKWDNGTHEIFQKDYSWQGTLDYEAGEDDGYDEFKEEVIAAYKAKKMTVPRFIMDDAIIDERIPMKWAKDAAGADEYWSCDSPLIYRIHKLTGLWRVVYCNDDHREIGVYPTLKDAKKAAETYAPDFV